MQRVHKELILANPKKGKMQLLNQYNAFLRLCLQENVRTHLLGFTKKRKVYCYLLL
jgi:hypothetical protein